MTHAFSLQVPADPQTRRLAAEAAGKYLEMVGGSKAEGEALAGEVAVAVDALAVSGAPIDLAFDTDPSGCRVTLTSGSDTRTVRHPLPARQP
jgi:hypothetical protein